MGLVIDELEPAPMLREVVRRVAHFDESGPPVADRPEGPMVGAVLIVSLGQDMRVAGERIGSFASGLWDRPVSSGHDGEQTGYEHYLDLLSARRLLGVPMAELANRLVGLEDLLGPFATELTERLAEQSTAVARNAIAQRMLASRLAEDTAPSPEVQFALARLRTSHGSYRIEELAADVASVAGYADQPHFNRDFRDLIGNSPGQFPIVQDAPLAE